MNKEISWEEQQKKLEDKRQFAVGEILKSNGYDGIIEFADSVDSPTQVGFSLGIVADETADSALLPQLLTSEKSRLVQFIRGFIWARYTKKGWVWVDGIDTSKWSIPQIRNYLTALPFTEETWKRTVTLLQQNESEYWGNVPVNPFQVEGDITIAINKLLAYNRPYSALDCIHKVLNDTGVIDPSNAIKALLLALSTKETPTSMGTYNITEIIKALQDDDKVDQNDLFSVEFAYLNILEHNNLSPKRLEHKLASSPEFFCEVIRIIYRSKLEAKTNAVHTEKEIAIAKNAYELLVNWRIPPGTQSDGSFSDTLFSQWLSQVESECTKTGHLEVAFHHAGAVLIHSPPDPSGLWIHHSIAKALNEKTADELRAGYHMGLYNSRGAHFVDPTGKPEKELAAKYKQQANDVERQGYHRLAITLVDLSNTYEKEAERIIRDNSE